MDDRALKLYGTEEPVPARRLLTAGPMTATFENGALRWIKVADIEVVRAIAFVVRDRNWGTATPEISDLEIDEGNAGFKITFTARCPTPDGAFIWRGNFTGSPQGTLVCVGIGSPKSDDFQTGRTGFVILHPLAGFVGKRLTIEHTDGSTSRGRVPEAIVPDQPWLFVRGMTYEPAKGVTATLRMEGDSWETEDHRNWTDASFKTYCRPLALPYPYGIPRGEQVQHRVTLKLSGKLPDRVDATPGPVTVKLGDARGRMPEIGLSVLPEDASHARGAAKLVVAAGVQHLNCRIDMRSRAWQKPLVEYAELAKETGAPIVLEVIVRGKESPAKEIGEAAQAVRAAKLKPAAVFVTPAADLKSYPPGTKFPEGIPTFEALAAAARKAFPKARIGGGMLSNFTELNRKRPPRRVFDYISHATSALVHAADDRSVMETLESIGHIIRSTRAIIGSTPYRIGPSHMGNSFNPYGSAFTPNPHNIRLAMSRMDPRHRALFGAAWHLGYMSQAAEWRIEAVTMASPVGEFGVAYRRMRESQPWYDTFGKARVYPVFHVIRGLAEAAGSRHMEARSSDISRVRAVAWRKGKVTQIWLGNIREIPVEVKLRGLPAGKVALNVIDEASFEDAVIDPAFGKRSMPLTGKSVTLSPFAVARLEMGA